MNHLLYALWKPVNNSRLVMFRILFACIVAKECAGAIANGEVAQKFTNTPYSFTFIGFEWLSFLHGKLMHGWYAGMALCALCVAAGLFYRFTSLLLALAWTATYLADKSSYNINHFYLVALLCWLMVFMPANKRFAFDVKLRLTAPSAQCYQWHEWLFIFQLAMVYFFAALAKINSDWFHAEPVRTWLYSKTGLPLIGKYLRNPLMPWLIAYGGLLFDLLIIPTLLYKRTRVFAFILSLLFHLFNSYVFDISMFPALSLALSVFFFSHRLFDKVIPAPSSSPQPRLTQLNVKWMNTCLFLYVLLQLLLPLRHWLIAGDVNWTEEGHRMSWRMMVRSKSGTAVFKIRDKASDSTWYLPASALFDSSRLRSIAVMPDVTRQAAGYVKRYYSRQKLDVAVYAINYVSLNHRPPKLLIDTTVDLASAKWNTFGHNEWIMLYR